MIKLSDFLKTKIFEEVQKEESNFYKEQMDMGKIVEKEHLPTYNWIKSYLKENNELPPKEDMFEHIAADHLNEFGDYYNGLAKMEKELKAENKNSKED